MAVGGRRTPHGGRRRVWEGAGQGRAGEQGLAVPPRRRAGAVAWALTRPGIAGLLHRILKPQPATAGPRRPAAAMPRPPVRWVDAVARRAAGGLVGQGCVVRGRGARFSGWPSTARGLGRPTSRSMPEPAPPAAWPTLLPTTPLSKLAFFPPNPPTYALVPHGDGCGMAVVPTVPGVPRVPDATVAKLTTSRGTEIVATYVCAKRRGGHRPEAHPGQVILFSHGNAVDLGHMLPFLRHRRGGGGVGGGGKAEGGDRWRAEDGVGWRAQEGLAIGLGGPWTARRPAREPPTPVSAHCIFPGNFRESSRFLSLVTTTAGMARRRARPAWRARWPMRPRCLPG